MAQTWYKDSFDRVKWWLPIIMFLVYFVIALIIQEVNRQVLITQAPNLADDVMASIIQLNTYPLLYLVMHGIWIGVFIGLLAKKGLKFFQPFKIDFNFIKAILFGLLFLIMIQQVFGIFLQMYFPSEAISLNQEILNQSALKMPISKMIVAYAVFPAVIEEIITRGLFMRYAFPANPIIGIFISSAIFAGLHATTMPIHALQYFFMGIVLAVVYWKTGRIEASIIIHLLNNLMAVAAMIIFL